MYQKKYKKLRMMTRVILVLICLLIIAMMLYQHHMIDIHTDHTLGIILLTIFFLLLVFSEVYDLFSALAPGIPSETVPENNRLSPSEEEKTTEISLNHNTTETQHKEE